MEFYQLLKTTLILGGVLAVMVGILYTYKRFTFLFPKNKYIFGASPIQLHFRYPIDAKNEVVQLSDGVNTYTLLLGGNNVLLEKTTFDKSGLKKEEIQ